MQGTTWALKIGFVLAGCSAFAALVCCGAGANAIGGNLDAGMSNGSSLQTNWMSCDTNSGGPTRCARVMPNGARPACVNGPATCGPDNYCYFSVNVGSSCLPPDVAYCDPDGGNPQCNAGYGAWPPDASGCGARPCVTLAGTSPALCGWANVCVPLP
jgi:hypothetical protein